MDRGQIFIGIKLEGLRDEEELNIELAKYGYRYDCEELDIERLDGGKTKYEIHYNDECDPLRDGAIFGIEAIEAYINCTDFNPNIEARKDGRASSGYNRDWIQELDLEKLAQLKMEVQQDIPDAQVYLMDLHY